MIKTLPTRRTGFAQYATDKARYPEAWRGLYGGWVPALGHTGSTLPNVSRSLQGSSDGGLLPSTTSRWQHALLPWGFGATTLLFNGSNEYVDMNNSTVYINTSEPYTVIVLARLRAYTADFPQILTLLSTTSAFYIFFSESSSYAGVNFGMPSGGIRRRTLTDVSASLPGIWQHIAVAFLGGNPNHSTQYFLYRNGLEEATRDSGTFLSGSYRNYLGRSIGTTGWWDGDIAYVLLYNRVLDAREVLEDYCMPLRPFYQREEVLPAGAGIEPPTFQAAWAARVNYGSGFEVGV